MVHKKNTLKANKSNKVDTYSNDPKRRPPPHLFIATS